MSKADQQKAAEAKAEIERHASGIAQPPTLQQSLERCEAALARELAVHHVIENQPDPNDRTIMVPVKVVPNVTPIADLRARIKAIEANIAASA